MKTHYYYYYLLDKNNNPKPGANFKTTRRENKKDRVYFTPLSTLCCGDEEEEIIPNSILHNNVYWYIRTDEDNNPIDMTLFRSNKALSGPYQEVYATSCCSPANEVSSLLLVYKGTLGQVQESDWTPESWDTYMDVVNANIVDKYNSIEEIQTATENIQQSQDNDLVDKNYTPVLLSVEIQGSNSVPSGGTIQLSALGTYDIDGHGTEETEDISDKGTWASSNTSAATVDSTGKVTAEKVTSNETTNITFTAAENNTISDTKALTVNQPTVDNIVLTLAPTSIEVSETSTSSVVANMSDGTTRNATSQSSYTSASTNIATVTSSGVITGVDVGTSSITATYQGKSNAKTITVIATPVSGVTLTPASKTLAPGETQQLTATVAPAGATDKTVSYSSGDEAVATVSSTGLVTAIAEGSAIITVTTTDGNKTDTSTITVTPTPKVNSVTVTPADASILVGATQQLSAEVVAEGGASEDVTWTSADEALATVDNTGLVTGVGAGTVVITATSTFDNTKKGTSNITITEA